MGHAVYAEGGTDFRNVSPCPFKTPEKALSFDAVEEYGLPKLNERANCFRTAWRAGAFGVPTILATGDTTLCRQVKSYLPKIETVAVKEPLSPYTARTAVPAWPHLLIKEGVKKALARRKEIKPFILTPPPYRITLIGSTPGFDNKSEVFEDEENFWNLIKKALSTVYDYELYQASSWPLVPRGEPILNKHERDYKKRLEKEGKKYAPFSLT